MGSAQSYEFNVRMDADQAKAHYECDNFVVRVYDGFDNQWCDCTGPLPWDEALKVLKEKTKDGTEKTKFSDIDYYSVLPGNVKMLYSDGFGENLRGEPEPKLPERDPRKCRFCCGTGLKHPENTGAQFLCWDCKRGCGDFMVKSSVWKMAMPEYEKLRREMRVKWGGTSEEFRVTIRLCVGCLSVRLGRILLPEDFTDAAVNDVVRVGVSMGIRFQQKATNDE